ncbi:MAG TPA: hypothetical protein VF665_09620 [Longimicrobium sp.]|jgi:hypothetical protein|uniref:hypothetical protein n=1 Tax=Longimicrobium sp. TaxID=2029185 RepID=UPI002EDB43E9
METIGFSTGSLARSDFAAALDMLEPHATGAVELSALRARELRPLLAAIPSLDLSAYHHVTLHGPSAFSPTEEREVAGLLAPWAAQGWTIVVHPDSIRDFRLWAGFGASLSIENMDARNPCGRTTGELHAVFARLPHASFCLDLAHARQLDPSMHEARRLLGAFGERLSHVHVSELDAQSRHVRLSEAAVQAYEQVAELIPLDTPVIIEAPVSASQIEAELERSLRAVGRAVALV